MDTDARKDIERLRAEVLAAKREATRANETLEREKTRFESESNAMKATIASLQNSVDSASGQRSRTNKERSDLQREVDGLRADNARLRKDLAALLDSKLSHLRTPQVSFEQYRELLGVCERYAAVLKGDKAPATVDDKAVDQAREWVAKMGNAPFVDPTAEVGATPNSTGVFSAATENDSQAAQTPAAAANTPSPQNTAASSQQTPATGQRLTMPSEKNSSSGVVKESIVEGGRLVKIIRDVASGTQWSFHNTTIDTQFIVEFTFGPLSEVSAMGDTEREGRTLTVNLYPGETKPFVQGVVNGYKMSIRYGPPDEGFVPPTSITDAAILPVLDRVKHILENAEGNGFEAAEGCAAEGIPFIDPTFPPLSQSMARGFEGKGPTVQWLLPAEFLESGQREELCSSVTPTSALEGSCGDGWLVSAISSIAEDPDGISRLFSLTTSRHMNNGIYTVWVTRTGAWESMVLDAFLPCSTSTGERLFGAVCRTNKDLWVPLLEKAMAKCLGSYAALSSGDPLEALQDITGYPAERLDWKDRHGALFSTIHRHMGVGENIVVIQTGTSVEGEPSTKRAALVGLGPNRAFRLLATVVAEGFRLCLLRNNGGSTRDWTGPWSERSDMWARHPKVKEACDAAAANVDMTATMWMEWRDVVQHFEGAGVCHMRPSWTDIRIPTSFMGSRPSYILEVTVTRQSKFFFGVHQRDKRGLEQTHPDRVYGAFLITTVGCSQNGVWDAIAQSHNGTFWRGRDTILEVTLEPNERPYYIIPRRYSADGLKEVVLSAHVEVPDGVTMGLRQPTDDILASVRYSPVWKFDPSRCQSVTTVDCQINREPATSLSW